MAKQLTCYIGLGSNLGDKERYIKDALDKLARIEHTSLVKISKLLETTPLTGTDQPRYLNTVAELQTSLTPENLHAALIDIETSLGRIRKQKWSPRVIDLDLLLFGNQIINTDSLTVPHSQMHLRSFVLKSLCELDPNLIHPIIDEPINKLAARLNGQDFFIDPQKPKLINVAGIIGVGKTTLVSEISKTLNAQLIFEPYDKNPFMPDVYAGKKELALDSELYFLTARADQLTPAAMGNTRIALSDCIFDKVMIYAKRLLDTQQLDLYERIYPHFAEKIAQPMLVIYLKSSCQHALDRIHQRNRPYEQNIQLDFLQDLANDYEQLFSDWKKCPIIRISVPDFDCTKKTDLEHLVKQIKSYVAI